MENLIRVALGTKFPEEHIDNILLVSNATGNSRVAVEVLLGVYERPIIKERIVDTSNYGDRVNRVFLSYDIFKEEVKYQYNVAKRKSAWFDKECKELTEENIISKKSYTEDASSEVGMTRSEFTSKYEWKTYHIEIDKTIYTGEMELTKWNSHEELLIEKES
jgi:hypothetical protein